MQTCISSWLVDESASFVYAGASGLGTLHYQQSTGPKFNLLRILRHGNSSFKAHDFHVMGSNTRLRNSNAMIEHAFFVLSMCPQINLRNSVVSQLLDLVSQNFESLDFLKSLLNTDLNCRRTIRQAIDMVPDSDLTIAHVLLYHCVTGIDCALFMKVNMLHLLWNEILEPKASHYPYICLLVEALLSGSRFKAYCIEVYDNIISSMSEFLNIPWSNVQFVKVKCFALRTILKLCQFPEYRNIVTDGKLMHRLFDSEQHPIVDGSIQEIVTTLRSILVGYSSISTSMVDVVRLVLSQPSSSINIPFCRCILLSSPGVFNSIAVHQGFSVIFLALFGLERTLYEISNFIIQSYRALCTANEYCLPSNICLDVPKKYLTSISLIAFASGAVSLDLSACRLKIFSGHLLSSLFDDCIEPLLYVIEVLQGSDFRHGLSKFYASLCDLYNVVTGTQLSLKLVDSLTGILYFVTNEICSEQDIDGQGRFWSKRQLQMLESIIYLLEPALSSRYLEVNRISDQCLTIRLLKPFARVLSNFPLRKAQYQLFLVYCHVFVRRILSGL